MAKLKIYDLKIDKLDAETGMYTVSLVDAPAVDTNFLAFEKEEPMKLQFENEEKHIITGVALRADYPIYRNNEFYGEHYIVFKKETIRELVEKYSSFQFFNNVNLNHSEKEFVQDCILVESYFIDKERGICPKEFENVEDGSWIVSYKVQNVDLWNEIKEGKFKGFSIEGFFKYTEHEEPKEENSFSKWCEEMLKK